MSYEKEIPANVSKDVSGPLTGAEWESQMGSENKKKISEWQRTSEDNRVGVPVKKWTE